MALQQITSGDINSTTGTGSTVVLSATPTLTSPTITGASISSMASSVITSGTSVASTSGTSIDFTSIPSWVKRITVMFSGVSTSGSSNLLLQIGGASGVSTSGYLSSATRESTVGTVNGTAGFALTANIGSTTLLHGIITVVNLSGNTWSGSALLAHSDGNCMNSSAGSKALSEVLTRVRITAVNGTDTFDAGSINIFYE